VGDWETDDDDEEEEEEEDDEDMESGVVDKPLTSGHDGAGTLGIARIVCGGAFIARST
jgi:hypothetical protein